MSVWPLKDVNLPLHFFSFAQQHVKLMYVSQCERNRESYQSLKLSQNPFQCIYYFGRVIPELHSHTFVALMCPHYQ